MIEVVLEASEMLMAAEVGVRRRVESIARGRRQAAGDRDPGNNANGWQQDIEGALGEAAYAKARGLWWNGSLNNFRDGTPDVGSVQVRTRSKVDYDLIVRSHERDSDWFVLVVGQAPRYRIVGYIRGGEAKREAWKRNYGGHGAAYFVPQAALVPFEERLAA